MDAIITKASGQKEPFVRSKLHQSLAKAGASAELAAEIIDDIENNLVDGMTTKAIYKRAHKRLSQSAKPVAGRYHLKNGIMELGPSGFPFERYVSEILAHHGYTVQVGKIIDGKCVKHEVDVIAEKDMHHFMIECKYHNQPGMVCDVKIPLYIQARFKDIEAQWQLLAGHHEKFHQGWVVTNTRFTNDALTYGTCAGLRLVSLDHPRSGNLREMIESSGLYPLTCLTALSHVEKKILLERKIVLCREICHAPAILEELGIPPNRRKAILTEANQLCHNLIEHGNH